MSAAAAGSLVLVQAHTITVSGPRLELGPGRVLRPSVGAGVASSAAAGSRRPQPATGSLRHIVSALVTSTPCPAPFPAPRQYNCLVWGG